MRDILTVMKFTMKDLISRKSFRISTIIILVLIIVGFNIPNFLEAVNGGNPDAETVLVDRDNVLEGQLDECTEAEACDYIVNHNLSDEEIKEKLNNDELSMAVIISAAKQDGSFKQPMVTFFTKNNLTSTSQSDDMNQWIVFLQSAYQYLQVEKLNLSKQAMNQIFPNFLTAVKYSDNQEIGGDISVMMILSCILFFAIYFCAFQVSSSITTEKTSKIMETLVTSTSPRNIVIGKTLGIGIVGLLQVILFGLTAIICAVVCLDPEILDTMFDLSNFSLLALLVTLIYFLLGYFVYAFLYAVTGSTVSKPEDIQSANTPVVLLTMLSFYLAYFTLIDPTSNLNLFAALFPFSSAFCMPLRMIMGLASGWEIALSIGILVITCIVVAHIAIRIYSNAILNYGNRLSWKSILKLYKEK